LDWPPSTGKGMLNQCLRTSNVLLLGLCKLDI
jgi:hypothetical protein